MSETPMRGDAVERAALLTMPAGAVNEVVRAATEESMAIMLWSTRFNAGNGGGKEGEAIKTEREGRIR
jgi:hypothetical protein